MSEQTGVPAGFHTVTPYLAVRGIGEVLDFVARAFGAVELERVTLPDGRIMHAEVRIGDSPVMMGEVGEGATEMPAMLYLYVADVDAAYRRAVDAGGEPIQGPRDEFYGDRTGAVKDRAGNQWWLASRVRQVSPQEMQRHAAQVRHDHESAPKE